MELILKEKIRGLGSLGEVVKVKPGYARNFLLPQGKAMRATKANVAEFEARRAELEKIESEKLQQAEAQMEKLQALDITIKAKAGEGGKLFGSIGTRDLAEFITGQGVEIGKHQVRMPEGVLRQIGEYEITVHLHSDVDATLAVVIEAE